MADNRSGWSSGGSGFVGRGLSGSRLIGVGNAHNGDFAGRLVAAQIVCRRDGTDCSRLLLIVVQIDIGPANAVIGAGGTDGTGCNICSCRMIAVVVNRSDARPFAGAVMVIGLVLMVMMVAGRFGAGIIVTNGMYVQRSGVGVDALFFFLCGFELSELAQLIN